MRLIVCPAWPASSRQRCKSFNSAGASASIFLRGWRLRPGTSAAISHFRLAHLDDGDECAILIKSGEGPARVKRLRHGTPPSDGGLTAPKDATPSPLAP